MNTPRTPHTPYSATSGSDTDGTKDDEISLSQTLNKMADDEMESLLDEIESGYAQNEEEEEEDEEEEDDDLFDINYVGFGINDEEIEKQEIIIEELLDEIEKQELNEHKPCFNKFCKECNEKTWQYSMLVKDDNNNKNAIKLRYDKQKTFENFLKFEKIIASYSIRRSQSVSAVSAQSDIFINDTDFFYCPAKMDYLLHGYVRDIIRKSHRRKNKMNKMNKMNKKYNKYNNNNKSILSRIVPSVVIRLLHCYYSAANNKYMDEMKKYGINWNEHRLIVQHQNCNLWRWEFDNKLNKYRWKQCNGLKERGQLSLLYDEIKGFTRFVHFDKRRNIMRGLQIIEGNQKINHIENIYSENKSILEFGGFDYMYLFNDDFDENSENIKYGKVQKFKLEIDGQNHGYYAKQFLKCYNNLLESEIKNEIKMLKKVDLFPSKSREKEKEKGLEFDAGPSLNNLSEYVLGLQSRDDIGAHIKYSRLIRKLLSNEHQPPIQEIIDCGIIQRLIYLMQYSKSVIVKFECAWSLTNIASGTQEHTATLIKFNGIAALIKVFKNKESIVEIKEQCLWALGNIAGDSVLCRNDVLSHDILKYLLPLIRPYRMLMFKSINNNNNTSCDDDQDSDINIKDIKVNINNDDDEDGTTLMCQRQRTFMRNLVWTLSNLNRNKPLPSFNYIILSLHAINIILKDARCHLDNELMTDCCWTLSYLSDYNFDDIEEIQLDLPSILLDSGIIDILIQLLLNGTDCIKHPALRTIGNIATGSDILTNKLLNKPGILNAIANLLKNKISAIKRETLWLISNITAGDTNQIELILKNNNNILLSIMNILKNENEDNSVKREAVWALSNATSGGTDKQIKYICDNDGIYSLCQFLKTCIKRKYYGKVLTVCIEGLQNMLQCGLNDALLNAVNVNNPNQAILGQNTQNIYAISMQYFGGLNCLEQLLNDIKSSDDLKERIQQILDSYFPFRQFR